MKPTQVTSAPGSVNQLPPWTEVMGDIRLTPFYDINHCVEKLGGYVEELNTGKLVPQETIVLQDDYVAL